MKVALPIIIILVLVGVGIFAYSSTQKTSNTDSIYSKPTAMQGKSDSTKTEDKMLKEDSRYIEYSKANLDSTKNTRRVLFFYANWCPTCRPANTNFSQNENKIPSDVTLIRVNYNDTETDEEEKALAAKYGVTYQHTFVQINEGGAEVAKWNGGQITELLQNIK